MLEQVAETLAHLVSGHFGNIVCIDGRPHDDALARRHAHALKLILVRTGDIAGSHTLSSQKEGQTAGGIDRNRGDAIEVARDHDGAAQVVIVAVVVHKIARVHAVEGAEELLVRRMHRLVLAGQVADDGHVVGDERRK